MEKYFKKPDEDFKKLYSKAEVKPKYLMPVDKWLAIIIYPNLQVKNAAMQDHELQNLLEELKNFDSLIENISKQEQQNKVVQMDIGMIRNF